MCTPTQAINIETFTLNPTLLFKSHCLHFVLYMLYCTCTVHTVLSPPYVYNMYVIIIIIVITYIIVICMFYIILIKYTQNHGHIYIILYNNYIYIHNSENSICKNVTTLKLKNKVCVCMYVYNYV